jgi:hypothetical protein
VFFVRQFVFPRLQITGGGLAFGREIQQEISNQFCKIWLFLALKKFSLATKDFFADLRYTNIF